VDALWDEFGGASRIAEMIFRAYLQAPDGSMNQVRIVDGVMKLFMNHDSKHGKTIDEELDAMTEQQLVAMFKGDMNAIEIDSGPSGNKGHKAPRSTSSSSKKSRRSSTSQKRSPDSESGSPSGKAENGSSEAL
jgi:hypothetical protein